MKQVIKVSDLVYKYLDGTEALKGINFSARQGEIVAIIGKTGSGKTTLIHHFNGLLFPTKGSVFINDEKVGKKNLDRIRMTVGLVFQDPDDQLFAPTVWDDVAFGPRNMGLSKSEVKERVDSTLGVLGIKELGNKSPDNLSGGQKRLVSIAGVLAMNPQVIVLDEPTVGLDPHTRAEIIEILDDLNAEGKTIIFSTHDVDLAAKWAGKIYVIHKGRIEKSGSPSQVFADHAMIAETGLVLPTFVQTFRELKVRGLSGGDSPLTMLNFVESVSKPFDVLNIRCAIAGTDVCAGKKVGLVMEDGVLCTTGADADMNAEHAAFGRVMHDARAGEDIVVSDVTGTLSQKTGNIYIVHIPRVIEGGSRAVDMDTILAMINKYNPHKIGAMGTSAKVVVRKIDIHCDFDVDVIQSSILAALRGLNVMVFATGGMFERVIRKIESNNKQGQQIKYLRLT